MELETSRSTQTLYQDDIGGSLEVEAQCQLDAGFKVLSYLMHGKSDPFLCERLISCLVLVGLKEYII